MRFECLFGTSRRAECQCHSCMLVIIHKMSASGRPITCLCLICRVRREHRGWQEWWVQRGRTQEDHGPSRKLLTWLFFFFIGMRHTHTHNFVAFGATCGIYLVFSARYCFSHAFPPIYVPSIAAVKTLLNLFGLTGVFLFVYFFHIQPGQNVHNVSGYANLTTDCRLWQRES